MIEKQPKKRRSLPKTIYPRPFTFGQSQSTEQDMRVEVVPLIDVIFCILTFFILAGVGLSRQQAITLDLPKANTGQPQMREMLVVSLDPLGQVYIDKQLVTRVQLNDALKKYRQSNKTGMIVLNAARNASYNEVIQVLDVMRKVGGNRVALATVSGDTEVPQNNTTTQPLPQASPQSNNFGTSPNANPGNFLPRQSPSLPPANNPNTREAPRLP